MASLSRKWYSDKLNQTITKLDNMTIKTHISVTDSTIKDRGMGFKLSPLNPQSANIAVSKYQHSLNNSLVLLAN